MLRSVNNAFQETLGVLESELQVRHIATWKPTQVSSDDKIEDVLARREWSNFDQFPVRSKNNGSVVAVIERSTDDPRGGRIRPLDSSMLVSADESLGTFIPTTVDWPYRLVVNDGNLDGIVTKSDIQKLPVQIYAFTLLTHLETLLATLIDERFTNEDDWLCYLERWNQGKIKGWQKEASKDRIDPPLLEFTSLGHKIQILEKSAVLPANKITELNLLRKTRDDIAHNKAYAETNEQLQHFVNMLRLAQTWISKLTTA